MGIAVLGVLGIISYLNGPLKNWSNDQEFLMTIIILLCVNFNHASFDPASLNIVLQAIDPKKETGEDNMDLFYPFISPLYKLVLTAVFLQILFSELGKLLMSSSVWWWWYCMCDQNIYR